MIAKDPCPQCGDEMTIGAEIRNGVKWEYNFCQWCWYDERKGKKVLQDVGADANGVRSKVE